MVASAYRQVDCFLFAVDLYSLQGRMVYAEAIKVSAATRCRNVCRLGIGVRSIRKIEMRYIFLLILLGCGRKELIRDEPASNLVELPEVIQPVQLPPEIKRPLISDIPVSNPDAEIIWPDNKPIKLLIGFDQLDTRGNPIQAITRFELQQIIGDSVCQMVALIERSDYLLSGDTLIVNTEKLRARNFVASEEYVYEWVFRYRTENKEAFEKFSEWQYSNRIILVDAKRLFGIPVKPARPVFIR